jgi:hypothetical protein
MVGMLWYGSVLVLLFGTSIISLSAAGAQPAPSVDSLMRSPLEQPYSSRREARLQAIGFSSLAAAALLGLFGLSAGLSLLH